MTNWNLGDSSSNSNSTSAAGFDGFNPAVKYILYGLAGAVGLSLLACLFLCWMRRRKSRRAVREAAIAPKQDFSRYESSPYYGGGREGPQEYGFVGAKSEQRVYWK